MPTINVAKVLVINDQGEALLLRRSQKDSYQPGRFDYPGGGIETNEAPATAASRELEEEVGMSTLPSALHLLYASTVYEQSLERSVNRFFYMYLATTNEVRLSHEHDAYQWVPVEKVHEVFQHPVYSAAVRYVLQHDLLPRLALQR